MFVACFVTIDVLKKKGNFPQFLLLSTTTFVKKEKYFIVYLSSYKQIVVMSPDT